MLKEFKYFLKNKGFNESWFPGELSFKKDNTWIEFLTENEKQYSIAFYFDSDTDHLVSFDFNSIEFKDEKINEELMRCRDEKDPHLSAQLWFSFLTKNIDWLCSITKDDLVRNFIDKDRTSYRIWQPIKKKKTK